jgi:hypothetical protein
MTLPIGAIIGHARPALAGRVTKSMKIAFAFADIHIIDYR